MSWSGKQKLVLVLLAAVVACGGPAWGERPTAVVVVGPVDPPAHRRTRAHIAEAELVSRAVEQAGYHVARLYHPQATWKEVREASRGASLFVYYGHGNGYGWMGRTDSGSTNGLCLSDPENPDVLHAGRGVPGGNAEELASLELGPDSTVALIHTCYAAGSSQTDWKAVDYQTASTRVLSYADAFFRAGAVRYVATNYSGVAPYYMGQWTKGRPLDRVVAEPISDQEVHSAPGLLLVEASNRVHDPQPWVSAWVERPVQPALAATDERAPDYIQAGPGRRGRGAFRDWGRRERRAAAAVSVLGSPGSNEARTLPRYEPLEHRRAWSIPYASTLVRRFCEDVFERCRGPRRGLWPRVEGWQPPSCCPVAARRQRGEQAHARHPEPRFHLVGRECLRGREPTRGSCRSGQSGPRQRALSSRNRGNAASTAPCADACPAWFWRCAA